MDSTVNTAHTVNPDAGYKTATGADPYTVPTTKTSAELQAESGTTKGNPVKNVLAAVHGIGEKVRGEFNSKVDAAAGEHEGVAKNQAVANSGDAEINTGEFTTATKNREGVIPGDGERRNL